MKKSILFLAMVFTIAWTPKQSNEDANTRICYLSYSPSKEYGVQIKNKQAVATSYSITWPDGYIATGYPSVPAGVTVLAFHYSATFHSGTLSATPTVGGGTVGVYVATTLGQERCN